jgi:putative tryptophan/tyrosine transport system substrate-binding protein
MIRAALVTTVALLGVVAGLGVEAQQAAKTVRIAMVCGVRCAGPAIDAFWQTLRELGLVDGQNLVRDVHGAGGEPERLPSILADILAARPDVIVTLSPQPTRAARAATSSVPIVMAFVADPVSIGLVPSLSHPGGNLTGVTTLPAPGFIAKMLEVLKEAVPHATRVAVLWNSTNEIHRAILAKEIQQAQPLQLQLQMIDARGPDDLEPALEAAVKGRAHALLVVGDPLFHQPPQRLPDLALRHRLPAMFLVGDVARAGGLVAYGPDFVSTIRQAAVQVHKILRGEKPANIPIEQPTKFELVINMATAKALGLTIPPSLQLRADQIIE